MTSFITLLAGIRLQRGRILAPMASRGVNVGSWDDIFAFAFSFHHVEHLVHRH
jgi:hypothetical protein